MAETTMIRQGDVLLIRRDAPQQSSHVEGARGLRILGERTGHAHVLEAEVHDTERGRMLMLAEPGMLTHPEHGDLEVPAGWWEPVQQREFSPSSRPSSRAMFD